MKFQPFSSAIDGGFWQALADEKLNRLQLDDSPVAIRMYYHTYHHQLSSPSAKCLLHVGPSAFAHLARYARFRGLQLQQPYDMYVHVVYPQTLAQQLVD